MCVGVNRGSWQTKFSQKDQEKISCCNFTGVSGLKINRRSLSLTSPPTTKVLWMRLISGKIMTVVYDRCHSSIYLSLKGTWDRITFLHLRTGEGLTEELVVELVLVVTFTEYRHFGLFQHFLNITTLFFYLPFLPFAFTSMLRSCWIELDVKENS